MPKRRAKQCLTLKKLVLDLAASFITDFASSVPFSFGLEQDLKWKLSGEGGMVFV